MSDILWKKSMEKLKTDKSEFNGHDVFNVVNFIDNYKKVVPLEMEDQILRDVSMCRKYDAICKWVGFGGLIEFESELIVDLIKIFGIEE